MAVLGPPQGGNTRGRGPNKQAPKPRVGSAPSGSYGLSLRTGAVSAACPPAAPQIPVPPSKADGRSGPRPASAHRTPREKRVTSPSPAAWGTPTPYKNPQAPPTQSLPHQHPSSNSASQPQREARQFSFSSGNDHPLQQASPAPQTYQPVAAPEAEPVDEWAYSQGGLKRAADAEAVAEDALLNARLTEAERSARDLRLSQKRAAETHNRAANDAKYLRANLAHVAEEVSLEKHHAEQLRAEANMLEECLQSERSLWPQRMEQIAHRFQYQLELLQRGLDERYKVVEEESTVQTTDLQRRVAQMYALVGDGPVFGVEMEDAERSASVWRKHCMEAKENTAACHTEMAEIDKAGMAEMDMLERRNEALIHEIAIAENSIAESSGALADKSARKEEKQTVLSAELAQEEKEQRLAEAELQEFYAKTEACVSARMREAHVLKELKAELLVEEAKGPRLHSEEVAALGEIERFKQELQTHEERKDERASQMAETLQECKAHFASVKATLEALEEQLSEAKVAKASEAQDAKASEAKYQELEASSMAKRAELRSMKAESEDLELEISDIQKESKALMAILSGAQAMSRPMPKLYVRGSILGDFVEDAGKQDPQRAALEHRISELLASCDRLEDSVAQRSATSASSRQQEQRAQHEESEAQVEMERLRNHDSQHARTMSMLKDEVLAEDRAIAMLEAEIASCDESD